MARRYHSQVEGQGQAPGIATSEETHGVLQRKEIEPL